MRRAWMALPLASACAVPTAPAAPSPPSAPIAAAAEPPKPRAPGVGPHGEFARIVGRHVGVVSASGEKRFLEPEEVLFPTGDRAKLGLAPTAVLWLDDGTLVVGAADGAVTAIDGAGHRRFMLGLRGAIRGLEQTREGLSVTTAAGVTALVGEDGGLRWERDGAGPEPIFPLTFEPVVGGRFSAVVPIGSDEIAALVDFEVGGGNDWPDKSTQALVQMKGGQRTSIVLPHKTAGKDAFHTGGLSDYHRQLGVSPPQVDALVSDALITRPGGALWILGRRLSSALTGGESGVTGAWVGAGVILEPGAKGARERRDMFEALTSHPSVGAEGMITAAPHGVAGLLCFGFEPAACALHGSPRLLPAPARILSVARIGDEDWIVTADGKLMRRKGEAFLDVAAPEGLKVVAGTSQRDLWATTASASTVTHYDGGAWRDVPVPQDPAGGFFVRSADDVWAMHGQARWDGTRWSQVYGAPKSKAVFARGRDDVWLAGERGLWRGTAPGPTPVRLAAAPHDASAPVLPIAAPLGPVETRFVAERRSFPIAREEALTAARRVTVGQGMLWFAAWDRLVEVDGAGAAKTVRRGSFGFARTLLPESAGRGLFVEGGSVLRFTGPKGSDRVATLEQRTLAALDGRAETVWAVGDSEAHWPSALVRVGAGGSFQPALGLPAAAWADVAAAADGGAWFAGGLNAGPSGAGILVHARGASGQGGSARHRAAASLLAVAVAGPDEAWAVGAAGTILHVRGTLVTQWALPSGEWLRAVAVAGPGEVWLGGDGGTLLRFDGASFHPVAHPLGKNAAVTSIAVVGGEVWVVGPSGILRVKRAS